jgi:hypothetical protein
MMMDVNNVAVCPLEDINLDHRLSKPLRTMNANDVVVCPMVLVLMIENTHLHHRPPKLLEHHDVK